MNDQAEPKKQGFELLVRREYPAFSDMQEIWEPQLLLLLESESTFLPEPIAKKTVRMTEWMVSWFPQPVQDIISILISISLW